MLHSSESKKLNLLFMNLKVEFIQCNLEKKFLKKTQIYDISLILLFIIEI